MHRGEKGRIMYVCVLHFRVANCCLFPREDGTLQSEPEQVFVAYNDYCSGKLCLAGPTYDLPARSRIQLDVKDKDRGRYLVSFALDDERWETVQTKDGVPVRFPIPWLDAFESWDVVVSAAPSDVKSLLKQARTEDGRLYTALTAEPGYEAPYRYVDAQGWSETEKRRDANAEFALRLLQAVDRKSGNLMLSPASAQMVLGMLEEGAGGTTRKEIRKALGDADPSSLALEFPNVSPDVSPNAPALKSSNSLWVNGRTSQILRPSYVEKMQGDFDADASCMPFDKQMVEILNARVARDTDGIIAQMLDKAPTGVLLVLSCLAFARDWKHPFEPEDIKEGEFHPRPRASQPCTMLRGYPDTDVQLNGGVGITKAYADERFGLFALLPPKGVSPDVYLAGFTGADLRDALDAPYDDKDVNYRLPQLSLECGIQLNHALEDLGVREAFTEEADFGGISAVPLFVSEVLQKTRFELDARGTRAAAATMAMVVAAGVPDFDRILSIEFDRPFVLGIEDTETHVPIMLGIVREVM